MRIIITKEGEKPISFSKKDNYLLLKSMVVKLYDEETGNPLNDRIAKMDKCFSEWEPTNFVKIFNEVVKEYGYSYTAKTKWSFLNN